MLCHVSCGYNMSKQLTPFLGQARRSKNWVRFVAIFGVAIFKVIVMLKRYITSHSADTDTTLLRILCGPIDFMLAKLTSTQN